MEAYSPEKQNGAVLAISLIMLLVITLVGMSTFQSTALEEKMAASAQSKNIAFQGSEDAIESAIDDINFLGSAYTPSVTGGTLPTRDVSTPSSSNGHLDSEVEAEFIGFASPKGEEAGSIRMGATSYTHYNYEVRGSATISNTSTANTNVRGAYILGASAN